MAVGWAVNGVCYESTAAALKAFQEGFQNYDGTHVNSLTSSSISTGGVITYSISSLSLDNATAPVAITGTVAIRNCDYSFVQQKDVPDMVLVGLLFFSAFLGFLSGYRP